MPGSNMIVQIRGAGFVNKGAELMLVAAVNKLAEIYPGCQPVISYQGGPVERRRALGLKDLFWMEPRGPRGQSAVYNALLTLSATRGPKEAPSEGPPESGLIGTLRQKYQNIERVRSPDAVLGSDVDLVLDLSGFAYGDRWGPQKTEFAADYYEQVQKWGGSVVLMPQQLGPFEEPAVRSAFQRLSAHCDLIFARDEVSFEIAKDVAAAPDAVHQYPDFTVLQKGTPPDDEELKGRACIVPNFKMVEVTRPEIAEAYPVFLERCVTSLRARGMDPIVLVHEHEGDDHDIAYALSRAVDGIRIVNEPDPLRVKGIIGASFLTIGSRFHGLVSALSQAVPSLGTSWSHKYRMLFEEYGCPENLVAPTLTEEELDASLERLLGEETREPLVTTLRSASAQNAECAETMWRTVQTKMVSIA